MSINRSRVRSSPAVPLGSGICESKIVGPPWPDASWNLHSNYPSPTGDYFYEAINDEVGPRSGLVRPCEHVTIRTSNHGVALPSARSPDYFTWWNYNPMTPYHYEYRFDKPFGVNHSDHGTYGSSSAVEYSSFQMGVARSVSQHIPTQLSVPNFLLELDDIPRTIDSVLKLREFGHKTIGGLMDAIKGRKVKLGETVADHWLAYQFGIKPLISDVTSALDVVAKVDKRIRFLKRTYGKETKFERGHSFSQSGLTTPGSGSWPLGQIRARLKWRVVTQLKAGGYFFQTLGGLNDVGKEMDIYAAALGFKNPLSVAYNAIPFTFLVDYFTNIGDIFESFQAPVFQGEITMSDAWSSIKTTQYTDEEIDFQLPDGSWTGFGSGSTSSTKVSYVRSKGLSTTAGVVFDTTVTPTQIANIIALLQ